MRRFISALILLMAVTPAFARHRNLSINVSTDHEGEEITRCDQVHVTQDGVNVPLTEEHLNVAGLRSLKLHELSSTGVHVYGTTDSSFSVTTCKAESLGRANVNLRGNEVSVDRDDEAVVFLIVRAPQGAALDVDTNNGPISFKHVNGSVTARTSNGPISFKDCGGSVNVEAHNGPIAWANGSGSVKLVAENGPIAVKIDRDTFDGSLDARTTNGPVALKVPRNFRGGAVFESDGHGPIACKAEICRGRVGTFSVDEDTRAPRRIELGSGPVNIHVSTVNGPAAIKDID